MKNELFSSCSFVNFVDKQGDDKMKSYRALIRFSFYFNRRVVLGAKLGKTVAGHLGSMAAFIVCWAVCRR